MRELLGLVLSGSLLFFGALPATNNYELNNYGFGAGGTDSSSTSNYSLEGIAGEIGGQGSSTDTYGLEPGLLGSQLANFPGTPTFTNPAEWYNKLHLVIDTADNPSDTTYAVALSDDDFVTTRYVQSDDTVGASLGVEDFRTYSAWGSGSGMNIIGLRQDTEYKVKVKASSGEFSETGYGPEATASTAQVSIVFDIDVSSTDTETAAPYSINFGDVPPATVTDSPEKVWLDISSNADSGAFVYIVSQNDGLLSATAGYTIDAVTGDLGSLSEGIGAQGDSATQIGGGPLGLENPYDGASNDIGAVDTQFRQLLSSSGPITDGRASFILKIKTDDLTPAASDYVDIYTLVAAAAF